MTAQYTLNDLARWTAYASEFYQSRRHERTSLPGQPAPSRTDAGHMADATRTRRVPSDGTQSVEQVVTRGYFAVPPGDPVTALVSDREFTSKLALDDVIAQIRERYAVWRQNLHDIEYSTLAATNAMHDREAAWGPADPQQLASLHTLLQRLYQQERDERISLWRDVSRLRQALPESAQQYLVTYRRAALLESAPDGAP